MQPDQAYRLAQFLLPNVEREHKTTRKVLAAIPAEKGDYQPDPKSKSAFELAWHLAVSEHMFARMVLDGAGPQGGPRPEDIKTPADVVRYYDEVVAPAKEQLKSTTAETLATPIDFHGMFTGPGVIYLNLMMQHSAHHRGQLSVYLRPMGAKVPSIYGPSGDEDVAARA